MSLVHLLDDFLDHIESLPQDLKAGFEELSRMEKVLEELYRSLHRKRILLLKNQAQLDPTTQHSVLKKIDRDNKKSTTLLEEKLKFEKKLRERVQNLLKKLDDGIQMNNLVINDSGLCKEYLDDSTIPKASFEEFKTLSINMNLDNNNNGKSISINEEKKSEESDSTLYCYCKQVSWGDMIECENKTCNKKWFHYSCVGLSAPPKGKWFCKDCQK